jgi:hypothetical protein
LEYPLVALLQAAAVPRPKPASSLIARATPSRSPFSSSRTAVGLVLGHLPLQVVTFQRARNKARSFSVFRAATSFPKCRSADRSDNPLVSLFQTGCTELTAPSLSTPDAADGANPVLP